jgi:hypothetical protein
VILRKNRGTNRWLFRVIYRRKPPALPGRLPEFDVSWILQHPIPGVGILTVTDCGQAPLRGQQS